MSTPLCDRLSEVRKVQHSTGGRMVKLVVRIKMDTVTCRAVFYTLYQPNGSQLQSKLHTKPGIQVFVNSRLEMEGNAIRSEMYLRVF